MKPLFCSAEKVLSAVISIVLIAVCTLLIVHAVKRTDATTFEAAGSAYASETMLLSVESDPSADTCGGSNGGAPEIDWESAVWDAAPVAETTAAPARTTAQDTQARTAPQADAARETTTLSAEEQRELQKRHEDLEKLDRMTVDLCMLGDYDCNTDPGEELLCFGLANCGLLTAGEQCGLPYDQYWPDSEEERDPLGLAERAEDMARIDADTAEYIVYTVFHNHLGTPGDPYETFAQKGYYYLDGYYYIYTYPTGTDEDVPQIRSGSIDDDGRHRIRVDWYDTFWIEAEMQTVDGNRIWTIFSVERAAD